MPVDLERRDAVALITLNRPKALNALTVEMLGQILERLGEVEADPELRAVVITGAGERSFCAGADVSAMREASVGQALEFAQLGHDVANRIESFPRPVIAAVNGFALGGGCELALACDMRLASPNARIGLPEVTLGVFPGWGGTQRLPREVGEGVAKEMILSGVAVRADEAHRTGLVNAVHPQEELVDAALALGAVIASRAPLAVTAAKAMVNAAAGGEAAALLERERDTFAEMFGTQDQREGMAAFFEKREAAFTGQ